MFFWKFPQKGETVSCNFESGDSCGWKNENFTVSRHKSDLEQSGPEKAFQGEFYAFFYGAKNEESGAILEFSVEDSNENCLFLAYHMWGSHIGSLKIEVYRTNSWDTKKTLTGNQGNMWHCNGIDISSGVNIDANLKVRIHAIRGKGLYSIIGIDDVRVIEAPESNCTIYNCSNMPQDTGSIPVTSYSPMFSGSQGATAATIQTSDFFKENLPLIAGIPGGLVTFFVITGILYLLFQKNRKHKKDQAHHDDFTHNLPPLGFRADRYRSFPHNRMHQEEEEVYDEIKEEKHAPKVNHKNYRNGSQNNGFAESPTKDDYLTPISEVGNGHDSYLTPLSLQDKYSDAYTILPAITKPIDQVTANYPNLENGGYMEPKDLNMPKTRGKKISISDQGDVVYTDVSQHMAYANEDMVNRPYMSLSKVDPKF